MERRTLVRADVGWTLNDNDDDDDDQLLHTITLNCQIKNRYIHSHHSTHAFRETFSVHPYLLTTLILF